MKNDIFKNCKKCVNYTVVKFLSKDIPICMGNVNEPEKCILNKKKEDK